MFRKFHLLAITAVLLFAGCKKDEAAAPADEPTPPLTFDLSIDGAQGVRMLLDGQEVTISEEGNVVAFPETDGVSNDPPALSQRVYLSSLYDGDLDLVVFRILRGTLNYLGPQVINEDFYGFFAPNTYAYGAATTGMQGVELEWTDATGTTWSTQCGGAGQTGSAFQITEVQEGQDKLGPFIVVKATFTAQFHSCVTGAVKAATNGVLVLRFREFA
jgi:hypothetical protein